jgi:DNA helicase-2/ATP-dependent DNA helicase PcrA
MSDPFDLSGAEPQPGPEPGAVSLSQPGAPASPFLDALNTEQREAAATLDGALLVLAGAGTGKTRVLVSRLAHILAAGRAFPGQILAVTFTNKAAREMLERVEGLIGGGAQGLWLGTFHAICVRILRRHAELVGLKPNFTILDTDDQLRLLKQVMEAENLDTKKWPPRGLLAVIQRWKDRGLGPDRVTAAEESEFAAGRALALYRLFSVPTRTCLPIISAASATSWWTNTRTPMSPSTCGSGCWPRAAVTSAALEMTTSRSTDGAAPRWATSCASRRTFPAPR